MLIIIIKINNAYAMTLKMSYIRKIVLTMLLGLKSSNARQEDTTETVQINVKFVKISQIRDCAQLA